MNLLIETEIDAPADRVWELLAHRFDDIAAGDVLGSNGGRGSPPSRDEKVSDNQTSAAPLGV